MPGRWAVVTVSSGAIVLPTIAGFVGAMQFIRNEILFAPMRLGAREVALLAMTLPPLPALVAAVDMLAATCRRSCRQAQAYVGCIAMPVDVAPTVPLLLGAPDAVWQLAVPALGQGTVPTRAPRGEPVDAADAAAPALLCPLLVAAVVASRLRLLAREAFDFWRSRKP